MYLILSVKLRDVPLVLRTVVSEYLTDRRIYVLTFLVAQFYTPLLTATTNNLGYCNNTLPSLNSLYSPFNLL